MRRKLILIIFMLLFIPLGVNASNRIYFEKDEVPILQGSFYDVRIKVDSVLPFDKVDFNITSLSEAVSIPKVKVNSSFVDKGDTYFSLEAKSPQKSGKLIATARIKIDDSLKVGDKVVVKLIDGKLTSDKTYDLDDSELVLDVVDKNIKSNSLASLSSKISPFKFDKNELSYTVKVDSDVDKFDLVAIPEDPYAKVVVSSQKLELRKNFISVIVSREGLNDKQYKIFVLKDIERDEDSKIVKESLEDDNMLHKIRKEWIVVIGVLLVVLLTDLVFLSIRK